MAHITLHKIENGDLSALPVLEQTERVQEDIRRRAFSLFEQRGCEPGHEIEDWLKAEEELRNWPPLQTHESDSAYEFELPLEDFSLNLVQVIVTPSKILVYAKNQGPNRAEDGISQDLYRRIELPQPINLDATTATLDTGVLHITTAKAGRSSRMNGRSKAVNSRNSARPRLRGGV